MEGGTEPFCCPTMDDLRAVVLELIFRLSRSMWLEMCERERSDR